ncbi:cytochrome c oxidase subunit 2A [Paenibacillus thalictri]|uniref:Cytochrome c oxidase subunit 2A n=1 Tax=Paenibacillus thalictri TaxID=2527873 RepID=A0A4Q9DXE3_9BACL|nr:cytochrome c oxidase subunit 2A [Paenibacillus thalictri]TBL81779.1 cytochrome c oxidase subunit 2A [Paenibacillus thalictri]
MKNEHGQKETALNGTLVSVMLLGAFIVLTWLGVYFLYLHRG